MTKLVSLDEKTKNTWSMLLPHTAQYPFYSYSWHKLWFDHFGSTYKPFYLLINNECIAPFINDSETIRFSGGEEVADYLDLVGSKEAIFRSWPEIIEYSKSQSIKNIVLKNIPQNSPTFLFFSQIKNANFHVSLEKEDTTPIIELPATWEVFLTNLSRKNRHELKRKMRKFESQYNEITIESVENTSENMDVILNLMRKNTLKNSFLSSQITDFFRKLPIHFNSLIELILLTIDNLPAAGVIGFKKAEEILLYNSGFDEENYSGAGLYLKTKYLQSAVEKNTKKFNFLQGNERYKYELGGKDFFVYTITITL